MPTTQGNRKILDLKRWEFITPSPVATAAGSFVSNSRHTRQQIMFVQASTVAYLYGPSEDAFIQLPSPALAGSFAAGSSGIASAFSIGSAVGSTTIAAGSNGATLPQSTINLTSTTGFPLSGGIYIDTATNGRQLISYTGVSGNALIGCAGGTGTLATSQAVSFASLIVHSGSTNTLTINSQSPIARDLRGFSIHVMSGPNSGATIPISANTFFVGTTTVAAGSNGQALPQATINVATTAGFPLSGQIFIDVSSSRQLITYTGITATSFLGCAGGTGTLATSQNVQYASVITVPTQDNAFTTSSLIRIIAPNWYVNGAGTLAAGSFKKYDFPTNTWTTLSNTGLPASLGTDGRLVNTPSWLDSNYLGFSTGTTTSGGANTLTDSTKNWSVNQWTNYQIRIVSGTGAGQIRTIVSNTASVITVSGWNTAPNTTSVYSIEGNDDFIYYLGNNAVTMYRYSISNNSWITLSPNVARNAAPGTGMSVDWANNVIDFTWTNENAIINGRRIYSFRGNAGTALDYYDIPSNNWVSTVGYAPITETFTTGSKYVYDNDFIYIQKDATSRWFRYNLITGEMDPWSLFTYPQSTALVGNTAFSVKYTDGQTTITYIYMMLNTSNIVLRQMII
jgi:hypothetical protein